MCRMARASAVNSHEWDIQICKEAAHKDFPANAFPASSKLHSVLHLFWRWIVWWSPPCEKHYRVRLASHDWTESSSQPSWLSRLSRTANILKHLLSSLLAALWACQHSERSMLRHIALCTVWDTSQMQDPLFTLRHSCITRVSCRIDTLAALLKAVHRKICRSNSWQCCCVSHDTDFGVIILWVRRQRGCDYVENLINERPVVQIFGSSIHGSPI